MLRQPFQQRLGLDRFVTVDFDRINRGPFEHRDHKYVVVAGHTNVIEVSGSKQQSNQLSYRDLINHITDVHRQDVEHRTGRYPLQTLKPDI